MKTEILLLKKAKEKDMHLRAMLGDATTWSPIRKCRTLRAISSYQTRLTNRKPLSISNPGRSIKIQQGSNQERQNSQNKFKCISKPSQTINDRTHRAERMRAHPGLRSITCRVMSNHNRHPTSMIKTHRP